MSGFSSPWPTPPPTVAATTPPLELSPVIDLTLAPILLSGVSGVYIVSMRHSGHLEPIDVGESSDVGLRLA